MTVTSYDFDLLFLGLVDSKPTIASSVFSLMLLSIYPLSFSTSGLSNYILALIMTSVPF